MNLEFGVFLNKRRARASRASRARAKKAGQGKKKKITTRKGKKKKGGAMRDDLFFLGECGMNWTCSIYIAVDIFVFIM